MFFKNDCTLCIIPSPQISHTVVILCFSLNLTRIEESSTLQICQILKYFRTSNILHFFIFRIGWVKKSNPTSTTSTMKKWPINDTIVVNMAVEQVFFYKKSLIFYSLQIIFIQKYSFNHLTAMSPPQNI